MVYFKLKLLILKFQTINKSKNIKFCSEIVGFLIIFKFSKKIL